MASFLIIFIVVWVGVAVYTRRAKNNILQELEISKEKNRRIVDRLDSKFTSLFEKIDSSFDQKGQKDEDSTDSLNERAQTIKVVKTDIEPDEYKKAARELSGRLKAGAVILNEFAQSEDLPHAQILRAWATETGARREDALRVAQRSARLTVNFGESNAWRLRYTRNQRTNNLTLQLIRELGASQVDKDSLTSLLLHLIELLFVERELPDLQLSDFTQFMQALDSDDLSERLSSPTRTFRAFEVRGGTVIGTRVGLSTQTSETPSKYTIRANTNKLAEET